MAISPVASYTVVTAAKINEIIAATGVTSVNGQIGDVIVTSGVSSVNGQTGAVTVSTTDGSKLPLAGGTITGSLTVNGGFTVGNGASSTLTMQDSDEGARLLHCNSNRIGFLTQAGGWGSWCEDAGDWTSVGNVTAYSDRRLKTDLAPIPDALNKVQTLTGYTYTRTDSGARQTGLIAQDVRQVLPEAVMTDKNGVLSLAYGNIVGLLVEAIKELRAEVTELKSKQ